MMHYRKGENIEKEVTRDDLPFEDCMPKDQKENFLWMQVRGGTKVNNVISYAKKAFEKNECRTLVWSGAGGGLVKTVSCAEIMKRSFPLYQVTRMCYTTTEEHWKPQLEGLEEIVASRKIPCLHILMSLDPLQVEGAQKPNTTTEFWPGPSTSNQNGNNNGQRQYHGTGSGQKRKKRFQQRKERGQHQQQQQVEHQQEQQYENKEHKQNGEKQKQQQEQPQKQQKQHQNQKQKQQQRSPQLQRSPPSSERTLSPKSSNTTQHPRKKSQDRKKSQGTAKKSESEQMET